MAFASNNKIIFAPFPNKKRLEIAASSTRRNEDTRDRNRFLSIYERDFFDTSSKRNLKNKIIFSNIENIYIKLKNKKNKF